MIDIRNLDGKTLKDLKKISLEHESFINLLKEELEGIKEEIIYAQDLRDIYLLQGKAFSFKTLLLVLSQANKINNI